MRRAARWLLGTLAAVVVLAGALLWAFPAATSAAAGPADPIVGLRRSVLGGLRWLGLVPPPGFFGDPWLPSASGTRPLGSPGSLRWTREPVWRGLLWKVGERVSGQVVEGAASSPAGGTLRLVATEGGARRVLDEQPLRPHPSDPSLRIAVVAGFVPEAATRWTLERVGADGTVRWDTSLGRE